MIDETLRRIVRKNQETRAAYSSMSSRVISAILSGSDQELSDVIDELAGSLEGSARDVLSQQGEDQQSGGTDGSSEPAGEPAGATGESGSGESVGTQESVG